MAKPSRGLSIAIIVPPRYALPPEGYGGIEAMCATLANGLIDRGHRVVTISAVPRGTRAEHIATYDLALRSRIGDRVPEVLYGAKAARIVADLDVDVVHDNSFAGPLAAVRHGRPTEVTAHGPVEATVHNVIDVDSVPFFDSRGKHAAWLGRLSGGPAKGAVQAIEVARRAGAPLIMAGKCQEPLGWRLFDDEIRPHLGRDVERIGEVNSTQKWKLLGEASCRLFPIQWNEPFGMVMIEAMATGTPVIALNPGSGPDVVVPGVTGFACHDLDEMVFAMDELDTIDPAQCREHVREHFDAAVMTRGYERAYCTALGVDPPS